MGACAKGSARAERSRGLSPQGSVDGFSSVTRLAAGRLPARLSWPWKGRRLGQDLARVVHQVVPDRLQPVGNRGIATATRKMEATISEFPQLTGVQQHPYRT